MAYYNPHITRLYNPLYTANSQGFVHCSNGRDVGVILELEKYNCVFCSLAKLPINVGVFKGTYEYMQLFMHANKAQIHMGTCTISNTVSMQIYL